MSKPQNTCVVHGCEKKRVSNGLCDMHRKRLQRHGSINASRPDDWGEREKHPLYGQWNWMRRMRGKYKICREWEDFWKFVKDVGDRPSKNHRLKKIDQDGDYSPENYKWTEQIPNEDRAEYARLWRAANPDKAKQQDLRKNFGINLKEYNNMLEAQNGVCAICGKKNRTYHRLAVDHCHETGKIRGLLCSMCNRALGGFDDSVAVLKKAIEYLENY